MLLGDYSEKSDGFAVGRASLTGYSAADIHKEAIENKHNADLADIDAAKLGEAGAGWPANVADAIRNVYLGLCNPSKRKRTALAEEVPVLRALVGTPGGGSSAQHAAAPSPAAAPPPPDADPPPKGARRTALSLQVRAMQKGSKEESVRRNVIDAFSNLLERLGTIYSGSEAPDEFIDRINFWNHTCGLPDAIAKEPTRCASGAT